MLRLELCSRCIFCCRLTDVVVNDRRHGDDYVNEHHAVGVAIRCWDAAGYCGSRQQSWFE